MGRHAASAETVTLRPAPEERGAIGSAVRSLVASARKTEIDGVILLGRGTYRGERIVLNPPPGLRSLRLAGEGGATIVDGESNDAVFFRLNGVRGAPTRFEIADLTVRNYKVALIFYGGRVRPEQWNGFNAVRNVTFDDIGGRRPGQTSTAAILLSNSRNNRIEGNTFTNQYNTVGCGAFHVLYVAHFSRENTVANNRIDQKCGDPIRIRDAADFNTFRDNVFLQPATNALYTEWFCDKAFNPRCSKPEPECPPKRNVFVHDGRTLGSEEPDGAAYRDLGRKAFPTSCRCRADCVPQR